MEKMKPKPPTLPVAQRSTIRRQIRDLIADRPLSARDISGAAGIPEKEVYPHLEHLQRTLHQERQRLVVSPAVCKKCGFVFKKRQKLTKPGKCPMCRSETLAEPQFEIR